MLGCKSHADRIRNIEVFKRESGENGLSFFVLAQIKKRIKSRNKFGRNEKMTIFAIRPKKTGK